MSEKEHAEKRALIAMSGGVDSSVAAALMLKMGYECIGVTMKLYSNEDIGVCRTHTCCSLDDVEDARAVAGRLGMRYYVFNFADDFQAKVIDKFIRTYEEGGTPNPCIDCNRYMKFDKLYDRARELSCDTIVTGHYARTHYDEESGRWQLLRSENPAKDQTYVLYAMTQDQLAHTVFPLGSYRDKEQVRQTAEEYGFVNAQKPDSQDICFVQNGDYGDFIERQTGHTYPHGRFVDEDGRVLGEHKGLIRYTIGQRKGLGLALPHPMYVKAKDMERNEVILSEDSGLYSSRLEAGDFNWIWWPDAEKTCHAEDIENGTRQHNAGAYAGQRRPAAGTVLRATAKPRYRAVEAAGTAVVLDDGGVSFTFDEPQRALTLGQALVLYDGERVIGGGTITRVPRT